MPRRKSAAKRSILPDPLFHNETVAKFINIVMQGGKKAVAEKIVYGALQKVAERGSVKMEAGDAEKAAKALKKESIKVNEKMRQIALEQFKKALDAVRPTVEVRSRRVGGATYQIPVEVKTDRGIALAMRWLVDYAVLRGEKTMALRLAGEILDALDGKGGAIKKREDVHKMAKANQAFAHYRW